MVGVLRRARFVDEAFGRLRRHLPGFVSPNALRLLQDRYDIRLIGERAADDLVQPRRGPSAEAAALPS